MNIKELNKLIKEELSAFFENEDELETIDAGDDIEITTDEPEMGTGDEAIDLLRQIYDLIKPEIEGEAGEDVALDDEEAETEEIADEEIGDGENDEEGVEEAVGYPNYKADQVQKVKHDASDVNKGLNESLLRMQKLAGLITEGEYKKKLSLKENVNKALYNLFDAHDNSYSREDFPKGKNSKTFPNTQGLKPGSYSIDIEDENISGKKVHFRVNRDNIIMSFNMLSESDIKK